MKERKRKISREAHHIANPKCDDSDRNYEETVRNEDYTGRCSSKEITEIDSMPYSEQK